MGHGLNSMGYILGWLAVSGKYGHGFYHVRSVTFENKGGGVRGRLAVRDFDRFVLRTVPDACVWSVGCSLVFSLEILFGFPAFSEADPHAFGPGAIR